MKNQTVRLTEDSIEKAKAPEKGSYFLWDEGSRGGSFGVRVFAGGKKTYVVRYRLGSGRGALEKMRKLDVQHTLKAARSRAVEVFAAARRGEDVLAEHHYGEGELTVEAYLREFISRDVEVEAPTMRTYEGFVTNWIAPHFKMALRDVEERHVRALKKKVAADPAGKRVAYSRAMWLLRRAMAAAEREKLRPAGSNPVTTEMLFATKKSAGVYLTEEEMKRLGDAMRELGNERNMLDILALLALTACRPVELLTLRWDQVDFGREVLILQRTARSKKTKTREQRLVVLNSLALGIFVRLGEGKEEGQEQVFPHEGDYVRFLAWMEHRWKKLRKAAKLPDGVRMYDLRHNFPSWAVMGGESLSVVQQLQGHKDIKSTEKYIHLAVDPIRQASERVAQKLAEALRVN